MKHCPLYWHHRKFLLQSLTRCCPRDSFMITWFHLYLLPPMNGTGHMENPWGNTFLFIWFWLSRSWHRVSGYYNSGFNSHFYYSGQLTRMVGQSGLMPGHYATGVWLRETRLSEGLRLRRECLLPVKGKCIKLVLKLLHPLALGLAGKEGWVSLFQSKA